MFAGSWRPYQAVSEQHSRRCGVTTAGRPLPRWAAVAQGESPFACISEGEPPSRLVWHKNTSSIVFIVHLAHNESICSLARDGRTMPSASSTVAVVDSQRRGDCCPTVSRGRSRGSRPSYAYQRVEPSSRPVWRKRTSRIIFAVRLAHITYICLLAHDGRTMPSTSSTVAVVESQPRGDRGHGGPRSLKGKSPFVCISEGGAALSPCLAHRQFSYCIVFTVRLAHNASICSLARDGRTRPSACSTVAVAESQWRGDRGNAGPRPCLVWCLVPETQTALIYYTWYE